MLLYDAFVTCDFRTVQVAIKMYVHVLYGVDKRNTKYQLMSKTIYHLCWCIDNNQWLKLQCFTKHNDS